VAAPVPSETFESAVRRCLVGALRATRGKVYGPGGAAERLGLHPSTLQTKLRKRGIDCREFRAAKD
jgi:formate hydrogenlyase transcriptional activator